MKYYFITYQASYNNTGSSGKSTWNEVIEGSPMKFIKHVSAVEDAGIRHYSNFVVINTLEITLEEYNEYKGQF